MSLTQVVLFPWFLLRLFLVVSPTLLKFALIPLKKYFHLILAVIFLVSMVLLHLWKSGTTLPLVRSTSEMQMTAPSTIDQEIEYWEHLRRLQPTHRDTLVNLAALYQLQGNEAKAQEYLEQARQLDPNNPLFQD